MQSIEVEENKLYSFRQVATKGYDQPVVVSKCIVWFDRDGMHFGPPL